MRLLPLLFSALAPAAAADADLLTSCAQFPEVSLDPAHIAQAGH
jgi:hypothetical protein